jgi:hypothetical protein
MHVPVQLATSADLSAGGGPGDLILVIDPRKIMCQYAQYERKVT